MGQKQLLQRNAYIAEAQAIEELAGDLFAIGPMVLDVEDIDEAVRVQLTAARAQWEEKVADLKARVALLPGRLPIVEYENRTTHNPKAGR